MSITLYRAARGVIFTPPSLQGLGELASRPEDLALDGAAAVAGVHRDLLVAEAPELQRDHLQLPGGQSRLLDDRGGVGEQVVRGQLLAGALLRAVLVEGSGRVRRSARSSLTASRTAMVVSQL